MLLSDRHYISMLKDNQFSIFMIIISISDIIILSYKYIMEESLHANIGMLYYVRETHGFFFLICN